MAAATISTSPPRQANLPPPPPPLTPPPTVSSMATLLSSLSHSIAEKLTDKKIFLSNQQVEPVIIAHRLHPLLVNPTIPPKFDSEDDRFNGVLSAAYRDWEQRDAFLRSWLQST